MADNAKNYCSHPFGVEKMAKKSFDCKDCGTKITVKQAGATRCENCGAIYKCYFEIKKEAKKKVISKQVSTEEKQKTMLHFFDNKTA